MNRSPDPPSAPRRIAGTSPARTTEDLPPPLGPTTARNLELRVLIEPRHEPFDQRPPPEEVARVGFGEGTQTLVRVAGVGPHQRGDR